MKELSHVNSEKLYNRYNSLVDELIELENNPYRNEVPTNDEEIGKEVEIEILIEQLLNYSKLENFYWDYCPAEVYKLCFDQRKYEFLSNYNGTTDIDFINYEIEDLKNQIIIYDYSHNNVVENLVFRNDFWLEIRLNDDVHYYLTIKKTELSKKLFYSNKSKITFLKEIVENQNSVFVQNVSEEPNDYSSQNNKERIAFLHELGVLKFLEDKMLNELGSFSANKLSEIVSTFTGIKASTAQSYLNPIFSYGVNEKNSALSEKSLQKVKTKLANIGFTKTKSS